MDRISSFGRRRIREFSCVAVLAATGALAPLASEARADSIVYLKGGNVWIAGGDGSGARQFSQQPYGWSSPSEADDGTVVVAGGLARINPGGTDSDGSSELYRFHSDGTQIGATIPTYGSYSSPSCPAYPPTRVRVSPDGSKIAYGIYACGDFGHMVSLWTPSTSTNLNFPSQDQGQVDFTNPAWIDSSRFTISHAGPPTGAHWGVHDVDAADNAGPGWLESHAPMDEMTADAVISRTGTEAVVFFNDAQDWTDGKPRDVRLVLYQNPAMPADFTDTGWGDPVCDVALDASQLSNVQNISPSLSPDGTKVVWGDDRGIEMAPLDNAANCASITPRLLISGGSQPFYSKGNEQPSAINPAPPVPTPPPSKTARPRDVKRPHVTRSGNRLTCNQGTWADHPSGYRYRWTINGKVKRGAGGNRLHVTRGLRKATLRCSVTASNAAGHATATSAPYRLR